MGTEETDPALGLTAKFQPTRHGLTPNAVQANIDSQEEWETSGLWSLEGLT